MNRTYLLDEITKIRRVIIEKSGKFTLKECESIAAALEVDNVSLVAMLELSLIHISEPTRPY